MMIMIKLSFYFFFFFFIFISVIQQVISHQQLQQQQVLEGKI